MTRAGLRGTAAERRAAIDEIRAGGDVDADELAALVDCLGDAAKAVQRPAAEALRALAARGTAVGPALEAALACGPARRRFGAAYALGLIGPPPPAALPVLLDTLGLDDGDMRWAAAELVCRCGPRPAVVAALADLARAGNAPQRKMALYCLRDLAATEPAVEQVAHDAVADGDESVRLAAMSALARLARDRPAAAARLVAALAADDLRTRRAAAAALGTLGVASDAVLAALSAAAAGDDAALRRAAEGALAALRGRSPAGS